MRDQRIAGHFRSLFARESSEAVTLSKNLTHRFAGTHWNTP
jgi:hypothetical protein